MKFFLIWLFIVLFVFSGTAYAGSTTTSFSVTATVDSYIVIDAESLEFGNVSEGTHHSTATIHVLAASGLSYDIAIDCGQNHSSGNRHVQDEVSLDLIPYELYKDSSHAEQWGDNDFDNTFPAGSSAGSFVGIGSRQAYTVYGILVVGGEAVPGDYADNVVVTVHY
jgi:spore coat protein U-like protein